MTQQHWLLLLTHAFATLFMTGLIWVIQIVHYPLMARVGADVFIAYEQEHMNRITLVVGPAMLVELVTAALLLLWTPPGLPRWMALAGVAMVLVLWLSTALVQGPMHVRLARGYDAELIGRLVATNWLRTIVWTARGVLSLGMIYALVRR
jgi:hypothetical protein